MEKMREVESIYSTSMTEIEIDPGEANEVFLASIINQEHNSNNDEDNM